MLVKINNDSNDFALEIDKLKCFSGFRVASKAAEFAVMNCNKFHDLYLSTQEELKEKEAELYELKSLLSEKASIDSQIKRFL